MLMLKMWRFVGEMWLFWKKCGEILKYGVKFL